MCPQEIEQARELLEIFVKGVAGSLRDNDVFESFTESELNSASNASLMRWKQLVERIRSGIQATIEVPTQSLTDLEAGSVHVAKASFSVGNSLPDPWLVMAKAAINYSAFNGTKLMPACEPPKDDDGPPNTNQGMDCTDVGLDEDHAERLASSILLGGKTIELYDDKID